MTTERESLDRPWKPDVLARHAELLGPPPVYRFRGNMEYAAPGTTQWAEKAWNLLREMALELKEPSGV